MTQGRLDRNRSPQSLRKTSDRSITTTSRNSLSRFGKERSCVIYWIAIGGVISVTSPAMAQLRPVADGTLGSERSIVSPDTVINGIPSNQIDGGAQRGANLFHSFQEFNIDNGRGVYFSNPSGVSNILTRVTGDNSSQIRGTLGVLGNANLFLLNPNGILFGSNARLDIRGSFLASAASHFQFVNSSEFSATNPQTPPLLTVNAPLGLQLGSIASGGAIVSRGNLSAGQDLTLVGTRLDLQGQLVAGRDLTLQAANTITAQDSSSIPFVASANGSLLIQGNQGIEINALSHPDSGLFSGRNLVLRSDQTVGGDAHFFSGGDFRIERMDGSAGDLFSPDDPVILTNGNVTLGDYTGASLHILAGGNVTLGDVTITGTGDTATTINPNNTNLFNGSRTYADLATFNLTEYRATLNRDGSVRRAAPVAVPITVSGNTQATLDVRAGVDWATLGGLPINPVIVESVIPTPIYSPGTPVRGDIIVNGNIDVTQPAGLILLTNQFTPNNLPGTIAIRGNVSTSTRIIGANGGDIRVYGRGDITVGNADGSTDEGDHINIRSFASPLSGNAGNGGAISFATIAGSISFMNAFSRAHSFSRSGEAGNGGAISFTASGDITLVSSEQASYARSLLGNAGNGGAISFATRFGSISLTESDIDSSTAASTFDEEVSPFGNAGNGGAISFISVSGNISLTDTDTDPDSRADSGNAGDGGAVSIATISGNISARNWGVYSTSDSLFDNAGNGGGISVVTTSGNISLVESYPQSLSYTFTGNAGDGGNISFRTTSGDISLIGGTLATVSDSSEGIAGNAGAVSITTSTGDIFLTDLGVRADSRSSSRPASGDAAHGGTIAIVTRSGNIFLTDLNLASYSFSYSGNTGNGGPIRISAGGTIVGSSARLNSFSVYRTGSGSSGDGGRVTLEAGREIALSGLDVSTVASNGLAGDVEISGNGNLRIANTNILTAQQVEICFSPPCQGNGIAEVSFGDRSQAGNIFFTSAGNLRFSNSVIGSDTRGENPAGNIRLRANQITINDSSIAARARSNGDAGDITIQSDQRITITGGSTVSAVTSGAGEAGNITFTTPNFFVTGGAQILAETTSTGNGGSIFVNAPISLNLRRVDNLSPVLSVETSGSGLAGDITINTPSLTLAEQARITATATATATNRQGGGSVTLNASNLNLAGIVGVFAETQGQTPAGTLRLNPYSIQQDLNVSLTPRSEISASTSGSGSGGDLIVTAPRSITITGPGRLAVETSGPGNAGNMSFTTRQLTLSDGVQLSASTSGAGQAGDIRINAESFTLRGGAQVVTNTSSRGSAGNLTVQVSDRLFLTGRGTGLFASTARGSTGTGGNITIDPELVQLEDGATIAVNSEGLGTGGNISLRSDRLILNQSSITADTNSAQGGNITLQVPDALILRDRSRISTTAGTAQSGGDGGNITVNGQFIVAVPDENSDISANAFTGRGGNVSINAESVFGIEFRPQLTPLSDITASSTFGTPGVVSINTPDVDPNRGLVQLPTDVTDASRLIAQTCPAGDATDTQPNEFVVTGRGGLPPTPDEAVNPDAIQVDLVTTTTEENASVSQVGWGQGRPVPSSALSIVEADGWQVGANGQVMLVTATDSYAITPVTDRPTPCH